MLKKNTIKGMHGLRTMWKAQRSVIPEKQNSNYIKLYMLEKEKTRLLNEKSKIMMRLDIIRNRLKEIECFHDTVLKNTDNPENRNNPEEKEFITMSMDY